MKLELFHFSLLFLFSLTNSSNIMKEKFNTKTDESNSKEHNTITNKRQIDQKEKIDHLFQDSSKEPFSRLTQSHSTDKRVIFHISHKLGCSILINDTVTYNTIPENNFIDHMILHNNVDKVDTLAVFSNEVNVKFFDFNKIMNIFNVYFEAEKIPTGNKPFYIEFDYKANGIIKNEPGGERNNNHTMNTFMWKVLNQNFNKEKENLKIEVLFDLGPSFYNTTVDFSLNFTKSLVNHNITKYEWSGVLQGQEVLIFEATFPQIFKQCAPLTISAVIVFVGAVFIIFLVGMLYVIISTLFNQEI